MGGKASGCSVTSAVTVPSMVPVACDHKGGALASSRPKVRLSAQAPFRRLSHVIHEPPLSKESNWQTQGWLPRGGAAPNCQNACLYTTKPTLIGGVKASPSRAASAPGRRLGRRLELQAHVCRAGRPIPPL